MCRQYTHYVASGEVLVEADGAPFLCQSGQILLIPQLSPFAIRYYKNVVGYSGGFSLSILPDANALRFLAGPLHQGFWFDEGAFVSELFNMLALSFEKGDRVFVEKGLDLLLTRIKPGRTSSFPAAVSQFLESVFNPGRLPCRLVSQFRTSRKELLFRCPLEQKATRDGSLSASVR